MGQQQEQMNRVIPYLRGELSPIEAVEFEDALRSDPDLRQELDEVRETFANLSRALPDTQPADNLREVFRTRLAAEPQESIPRPSIPDLEKELGPRARRRRFVWVMAAAASIMIAFAIWLRSDTPPVIVEPEPRAALLRSEGDVLVTDLRQAGSTRIRRDRTANGELIAAENAASVADAPEDAPLIHLHHRVETGDGSLAVLQLTDRSRLWLDSGTSVVLEPNGAYLKSGEAVKVEHGRVSFDVTRREQPTREDESVVGGSADADQPGTRVVPFVVTTPHGHVRVRGTRFIVEVTEGMTLVVVLEGRVDVQNSQSSVADIRRIDPGWFAAIGTPEALAAMLPEDPLPDARDADDPRGTDPFHNLPAGSDRITPDEQDAGVGGYTVPPFESGEGMVVVARPLVRVTVRLSHLQVFATGMPANDVPVASVTVHNVSPLVLRTDHIANRDNVKIKFLAPEASSAGWAQVTLMGGTLQPGERKRYEKPLQTVLYRERYGTYYLGGVYDGPIRILGLAHPDLRNRDDWTQVANLHSASRRHSVLYQATAPDESDGRGGRDGSGHD